MVNIEYSEMKSVKNCKKIARVELSFYPFLKIRDLTRV